MFDQGLNMPLQISIFIANTRDYRTEKLYTCICFAQWLLCYYINDKKENEKFPKFNSIKKH